MRVTSGAPVGTMGVAGVALATIVSVDCGSPPLKTFSSVTSALRRR